MDALSAIAKQQQYCPLSSFGFCQLLGLFLGQFGPLQDALSEPGPPETTGCLATHSSVAAHCYSKATTHESQNGTEN